MVQQTISAHHCTCSTSRRCQLPPILLQGRDQSIDVARPIVDATTMPGSTIILRASIIKRPPPRHRQDSPAPCRLVVQPLMRYMKHHTTSRPLQTLRIPRQCPKRESNTRSGAIMRSYRPRSGTSFVRSKHYNVSVQLKIK
jgi:hypothetical protein